MTSTTHSWRKSHPSPINREACKELKHPISSHPKRRKARVIVRKRVSSFHHTFWELKEIVNHPGWVRLRDIILYWESHCNPTFNSGDIYWFGPVAFTFYIERVFHVKNSWCHSFTLYSCFSVFAKCLFWVYKRKIVLVFPNNSSTSQLLGCK